VSESDLVRRFVLERHPIRGHAVRLSQAWRALREHQDYPPAVQHLLGEAVGAIVLLAATLKFDGLITLQLQGKGLVNLLVAQCTHDFKVRAMARHDPIGGEAGFRSLAGEGQIVVTVEATDRASSYQGVVPITGNSLAESLEAYFEQSEQLPTRVLLAASSGVVSGMLVQRYSRRRRHAGAARRDRARGGVAEGR
jgi:molecular chaperone Hsp33